MTDLAAGVWNLEPRNYWDFVEYVTQNPPAASDIESYNGARSYLKDTGVKR